MPSEFNRPFGRLSPCDGQVAYALLTRPPLATKVLLPRDAARLACVRPAASVYPEPGSNSPLYKFFLIIRGSECMFFFPFILFDTPVKVCSNALCFLSVFSMCVAKSVSRISRCKVTQYLTSDQGFNVSFLLSFSDLT